MSKNIVIVDYGMGNLKSVENAIAFLGEKSTISNDVKEIEKADVLILPGVGAFSEAMNNLKSLKLIDVLNEKVLEQKVPFFGICLGMQMIAEDSEEGGLTKGLGWIEGNVRKIPVKEQTRLPHIGWNDIRVLKKDPMFSKVDNDFNFYFVHSFRMECDASYVSAECEYDTTITAAVQKDNIFAVQFHPEKSQENGLRLLRGFLNFVNNKEVSQVC